MKGAEAHARRMGHKWPPHGFSAEEAERVWVGGAPDPRAARTRSLEASRTTLIAYLKMKLEAEDWHGCQDAASDLRDVDSELKGLRL